MKIKTKIALQYALVTTLLMTLFASVVYWTSSHDREIEFYKTLEKEGLSKANLFFQTKASPELLQSIYKNNVAYIDEVKVNIYDAENNLIYHDAETEPNESMTFLITSFDSSAPIKEIQIGDKQLVLFSFSHQEVDYIIAAMAYDGYGYNKQNKLLINLIIITCICILLSFILGYYLAQRALKPVADISNKMHEITDSNLDLRLIGYNEKDEFGELAKSFNTALDIIEKSFSNQKMFVSNVSHELRTPLAIIAGEIDFLLLKQRSVGEYQKTLESTKIDVERLISLTNGLLTLAKASYNEHSIKMSLLRIDEILLDARELALKNDTNRKVFLHFEEVDSEKLNLSVQGNEYLLKTAFLNLIENSCKFSTDCTSIIKIASNQEYIYISFADKGIGISSSDIEAIFEPFYRGQNKQFAEGSGIGLALVQKVVALHRGKIEIESELGIGTEITLSFPIS